MGTDLLFHRPETYRAVLESLPESIRIAHRWESSAPTDSRQVWLPEEVERNPAVVLRWGDGEVCPLYIHPIAHVLLADPCGNTLWMHEAPTGEKYKRFVGEAAFDKFGLQGSMLHFGESFDVQGRRLVEAMFLFTDDITKTDFNPDEDYGSWDDMLSTSCPRCGASR